MVKGIETFRKFFKDYDTNYIIIGGTACDILFDDIGIEYRATKDIDMILIVEALSEDFVAKFWEFVKLGNYAHKQKSTGDKKFYRFMKPVNENYPFQLELFSRKADFLDENYKGTLTPIPTGDDLSSLSAILMNDNYYSFTIDNSEVKEELHIASAETLICLKAKAYLDLKQRKEDGSQVDSNQFKKHKLDVLRLTQLLTSERIEVVSEVIKNDLYLFLDDIANDENIDRNLNSLKIRTSKEEIIEQIRKYFKLS